MRACTKYLHRHPLEVALPPQAFAELQALYELEEPDICPDCRRALLEASVRRTCDQCGKEYADQQTIDALSHP